MNKLDRYLVFSIGVLLCYAIAELVLSTRYHVSHDVLTTVVFSAFGGEFLVAGLIKIFNIKEKDHE